MNNSNTFTSKLAVTTALTDSLDAPKLKAGGASNSTVINRFHEAITKDISSLLVFINQLIFKASRIADATVTQGSSVSATITSLTSRVDALSSSANVLADLFTSYYVSTTGSDTTATILPVFGQATLPITATQDLLFTQDSYGHPLTSDTLELSYSSAANPSNSDYVKSAEGVGMILRKGVWVINTPGSGVWVKLKAPLQYLGLNPNVFEIYPFPCFGTDISSIQVQYANQGLGGTWTDVDMSYLPGYDSGSGKIVGAGPLRIHLDGTPITQIRFKMTPKGAYNPGLYNLRVLSVQYAQSASLTVQDIVGRTIAGVTILGKDQTALSALPVTGSGTKTRVDISSPNTYFSPVITGISMSF